MVYEAVAIDFFKKAEGRWEDLQIIYPEYNLWNDNPYYVLHVPWSSPAKEKAAEAFLKFLMSEPAQVKALEHGFRPGNPAVPIRGPASPFGRYASSGLKVEIPDVLRGARPASDRRSLARLVQEGRAAMSGRRKTAAPARENHEH